jgi:SAM-dependent methyltransferase
MGSAEVQGELWGQKPVDWTYIQEPMSIPLWTAMLNAAEVGPGTSFLDAGCGGGGASVLAAKRGARVAGLDVAEGLIMVARDRVPEGDFRVGDIEILPFEDGMFDVVFAANAIQYAKNRVTALRELGRVCNPHGRVVIAIWSTPDKVEFRAIMKAKSDVLPNPLTGGGPFALSEPGILEGLIEQVGLTILTRDEVNCPFEYPDLATFWRGNSAGGIARGIIRVVGKETLKVALQKAVFPFTDDTGVIRIAPNMFQYFVATPKAPQ